LISSVKTLSLVLWKNSFIDHDSNLFSWLKPWFPHFLGKLNAEFSPR